MSSHASSRRFGLLCSPWLMAGVILGLYGLGTARAAEAAPDDKAKAKTYEVELIKDVPYYDGPNAHKVRHKLDLYLPKDCKDFPVLFFVHGGAWVHGDKSLFGLHRPPAMYWARHGVGVVMTNYRLAPDFKFPTNVQDVAKAFAWTYRNIAKYHGRPDQLFLWGHSAGGHLVSLLATDDSYLKAEGLKLADVAGVISMSGVYQIPEDDALFETAFGTDPKVRKAASPLAHVRADAPPFLVLYAEHDLPWCGKQPSEEFCKALRGRKCVVQSEEIKARTHVNIFFKAVRDDDPVVQAVGAFMSKCTTKK